MWEEIDRGKCENLEKKNSGRCFFYGKHFLKAGLGKTGTGAFRAAQVCMGQLDHRPLPCRSAWKQSLRPSPGLLGARGRHVQSLIFTLWPSLGAQNCPSWLTQLPLHLFLSLVIHPVALARATAAELS